MRGLITQTEARRLDLVDLLMSTSNWVKIDELASAVDCSQKTVLSDLNFFKIAWSKYFVLDFLKEKGVRLISCHGSKIKNIFAETIRNSQCCQFYEMLFFHPNKSVKFFCERMYLSEASLYRIIERINNAMNKVELMVETKPLCSVGKSEINLRIRTVNYFDQTYLFDEWPFEAIEYRRLSQLIAKIASSFNSKTEFYDAKINNLCICLAVSLYRFQQGFSIDSGELDFPDDQYDQILLAHQDELQSMVKFPLTRNWYKDCGYILFLRIRYWQQLEEKERNYAWQSLENFIVSCSLKIDFGINSNEICKLVEELSYIYTEIKYNFSFYLRSYENTSTQVKRIKKNYPEFFQIFNEELKKLESVLGMPWHSCYFDRVLLTLFSQWEGLFIFLRKRMLKVKVFVVSSKGRNHLATIVNLLDLYFGDKIQLESFDCYYFDVEPEEIYQKTMQANLIISNDWYPILPLNKLFMVDDIPSNAQLHELGKIIENIQYRLIREKQYQY